MRAGSGIGGGDGGRGGARRGRAARDLSVGADGEPRRQAGCGERIRRGAAGRQHGRGVRGAHKSAGQCGRRNHQPRVDGNREVGCLRQMGAGCGIGNRNGRPCWCPQCRLPVIAPPALMESPAGKPVAVNVYGDVPPVAAPWRCKGRRQTRRGATWS